MTVDDEEGSHDSLSFQQLQTMLLEQFGENFFFFLWFSTSINNLITIKCLFYKLQLPDVKQFDFSVSYDLGAYIVHVHVCTGIHFCE